MSKDYIISKKQLILKTKKALYCLCTIWMITATQSISASAGWVYDPFVMDIVGEYCPESANEDRVYCLNDVLNAINNVQDQINDYKNILSSIRGSFVGRYKPFESCDEVEISGRVQTRVPPKVAGKKALCAAEWNRFAGAVDETHHEACEVSSSFRDSAKINRLEIKAEKYEREYDNCFADMLKSVYGDFAETQSISNGPEFFEQYKKIAEDYRDYRLASQLQTAYTACTETLRVIAGKNRALAEDLKLKGACR